MFQNSYGTVFLVRLVVHRNVIVSDEFNEVFPTKAHHHHGRVSPSSRFTAALLLGIICLSSVFSVLYLHSRRYLLKNEGIIGATIDDKTIIMGNTNTTLLRQPSTKQHVMAVKEPIIPSTTIVILQSLAATRTCNSVEKAWHGNTSLFCPEILVSGGTWKTTDEEWSWTPRKVSCIEGSSPKAPTPNITSYIIPKQAAVRKPWDSKNNTVVFYGSSHLRELYFSFIRLDRGLLSGTKLERVVMNVGSGHWGKNCDPNHTGFVNGNYGLDLINCGSPSRRLVPELGEGVAIGFKTFLHTPEADGRFASFLESNGLQHPDVVILDAGIWGTRGGKMNGTMTPIQEIEYYIRWVRTTFPSSQLVWIFGGSSMGGLDDLILPRLPTDASSVIVRKDLLMKNKPRRRKLPCGHGCAGPVIDILALLIRDWLICLP